VPPFDWMFDPGFRAQIEAEARRAARDSGKTIEDAAIDFIWQQFVGNRERRRDEELKRPSWQQRGASDALQSVRSLVSSTAQTGGRTLTARDVQTEFNRQFCKFWPIC